MAPSLRRSIWKDQPWSPSCRLPYANHPRQPHQRQESKSKRPSNARAAGEADPPQPRARRLRREVRGADRELQRRQPRHRGDVRGTARVVAQPRRRLTARLHAGDLQAEVLGGVRARVRELSGVGCGRVCGGWVRRTVARASATSHNKDGIRSRRGGCNRRRSDALPVPPN